MMRPFIYALLASLALGILSCSKDTTNQNPDLLRSDNYELRDLGIWGRGRWIRLDTRNGKMILFPESRTLNNRALVAPDAERAGRFTLYSTSRGEIILLDKISGDSYWVWSKGGYTGLAPIR